MHPPIYSCLHLFQDPIAEAIRNGYFRASLPVNDFGLICNVVAETCSFALSNETYLSYVSERSYRHDNGFDKVVLYQGDQTIAEARLHLWHGGSSDETVSGIHNHTAHFASLILHGELSEAIYVDSADQSAIGLREYCYSSRGEKDHYGMDFVGITKLNKQGVIPISKGMIHAIRDDILHSSARVGNVALTLFCQSRRTRSNVRVLSPLQREWTQTVESPRFQANELRTVLNRVFELVTGTRSVIH